MDERRGARGQQLADASSFLRFGVVGSIGFAVDAAVLLALVHGFGVDPVIARVFSFSIAVTVTFELNRNWSFGAIRQQRLLAAFATYLGVQGAGLLLNLAVFSAANTHSPPALQRSTLLSRGRVTGSTCYQLCRREQSRFWRRWAGQRGLMRSLISIVQRHAAVLILAFVLVAITGLYSVHLGVSEMWDIRNYHLYNPFALLGGVGT